LKKKANYNKVLQRPKESLVYKMKLIKTKKEYQDALNRLEQIFDAQPGSEEGNELEILSLLIEKYEEEHYPIA